MILAFNRESWQKNQKVERTSPGSKNKFKITYLDGQEKWTDDRPGDGEPGPYERRKKERKQSRPSIKDAKGTLHSAVKKFVDGGEKSILVQAVDDVIVHVGREVAREVIRGYLKEHKEGAEGKTAEAHEVIKERQLAKLRNKTAMRIDMISNRIASEVTDIMADQVRHNFRSVVHALNKAFGRTWTPMIISHGRDSVIVKFKAFKKDDEKFTPVAGFILRYDVGQDTYIFTPFVSVEYVNFNGNPISDFYVEDLGDGSKLEGIFEDLKSRFEVVGQAYGAREASIVARVVQATLDKQKLRKFP